MLFTKLVNIAKTYPNNLAINQITFKDLIAIIEDTPYQEIISHSNSYDILISLLKAASCNKPVVICPISHKNNSFVLPDSFNQYFGIYLFSSGTLSKIKKPIFLSEEMLLSNAVNSSKLHGFTESDKILTVCSMNHTGGINAQTLPALLSGSHIIFEKFQPKNYFNLINQNQITFSHLVPRMIDSLINSKQTFINSSLKAIMAGSDCVTKQHINFFLDLGVKIYTNYGLTQAGPIILNHLFSDKQDLKLFEKGQVLGTQIWANSKIDNGELVLFGKNISIDGWLYTDDCIEKIENCYYYKGRKSAGCKIIRKSY